MGDMFRPSDKGDCYWYFQVEVAPLTKKKKKKPTQQNLRAALSTSFSDPTWNISLFILVEFVYLFSPISVFLSLIFDNSTTICTLLKAGFSPGFIIGLSRETPQSTWRNNLPRN